MAERPGGTTIGIQWIERLLSCGVDDIDAQHRQLIRKVNDLAQAAAGGQARESIAEMLGFLGDYAATHFACEEEEFARRRCAPRACAANRVAHRQFLEQLTTARRDFEQGGTPAALQQKLESWLMNWLIHHIKTVDVRYLRDAVATPSSGLSGE